MPKSSGIIFFIRSICHVWNLHGAGAEKAVNLFYGFYRPSDEKCMRLAVGESCRNKCTDENDWARAAFYTGVMATYQTTKDRKYLDAAIRGQNLLTGNWPHGCGMLDVQPIGGSPEKVTIDNYQEYGSGAFLLAGGEVYKLK
jgi:hypothetical protein